MEGRLDNMALIHECIGEANDDRTSSVTPPLLRVHALFPALFPIRASQIFKRAAALGQAINPSICSYLSCG